MSRYIDPETIKQKFRDEFYSTISDSEHVLPWVSELFDGFIEVLCRELNHQEIVCNIEGHNVVINDSNEHGVVVKYYDENDVRPDMMKLDVKMVLGDIQQFKMCEVSFVD